MLQLHRATNRYQAQLYITRKVYGDPDRWMELEALNGIMNENPYRAGDCLKVFDVEW